MMMMGGKRKTAFPAKLGEGRRAAFRGRKCSRRMRSSFGSSRKCSACSRNSARCSKFSRNRSKCSECSKRRTWQRFTCPLILFHFVLLTLDVPRPPPVLRSPRKSWFVLLTLDVPRSSRPRTFYQVWRWKARSHQVKTTNRVRGICTVCSTTH